MIEKKTKAVKKLTRIKNKILNWEWFIIFVVFIISFMFGIYGHAVYFVYKNEEYTLADLLFGTLQLFTLNSGITHVKNNFILDVSRLLSPAIAAYALLKTIFIIFSDEVLAFKIKWFYNKHIVFCGLNHETFVLVDRMRDYKAKMLVIEQNRDNSYIPILKDMGVGIIVGNLMESDVLKKASIGNADFFFSLIDDDNLNSHIVNSIGEEMHRSNRNTTLKSVININDVYLYYRLREEEFKNRIKEEKQKNIDRKFVDAVSYEHFNLYDFASEMLLNTYPPFDEKNKSGEFRILIIGTSSMIEFMTINLVNKLELEGFDRKINISIIDKENAITSDELKACYPKLEIFSNINIINLNNLIHDIKHIDLINKADNKPMYDIIYVCNIEELANTSIVLNISEKIGEFKIPIYVCCERLSSFLNNFTENNETYSNVKIFEIINEIITPEILINGIYERLAIAIHAKYVNSLKRGFQKIDISENWNGLGETEREANRNQAKDIISKLNEIGCGTRNLTRSWKEFKFSDDEIEKLARAEHERWLNEKRSNGWSYAEKKNDEKKEHPNFKNYDTLEEKAKNINRDFVRNIPYLLSSIRLELYRENLRK